MKERGAEPDAYWTEDRLLGEVPLPDGAALVRLRLHQRAERIPDRPPLLPLTHPAGSRRYLHAQPYVLAPEIALTVGLSPTPRAAHGVGEVLAATWDGMRHVTIGQAQAWFYPGDRLLLLWECYLFDPYRQDDPLGDPALIALWRGFETELLARFPAAERLATPAWEDLYDRSAWQAFLARRGYAPATAAIFSKPARGQPG